MWFNHICAYFLESVPLSNTTINDTDNNNTNNDDDNNNNNDTNT